MINKILFTIIFICTFSSVSIAQELQTQVKAINNFIEQHSDSDRNYYAKINATSGEITFYNAIMHSMQLTFPVDKIDAENIKVGKKGLTFYPNESGLFVGKTFGGRTTPIKTAWLNVINMSKADKNELKNMMIKFVTDFQATMKP